MDKEISLSEISEVPSVESVGRGVPAEANRPSAESYLPMRQEELVEFLIGRGGLGAAEAGQFRLLCNLLHMVLHQDFHQHQELLKRQYAPFDPDTETRPVAQDRTKSRGELLDEFMGSLSEVLTAAHYRPLAPEDLDYALSGATYWGLDLQINRSIFDRLMIYVRGDDARSRVHRSLNTRFRSRIIDLEIYQRLVLVVKLRSEEVVSETIDTESLYIKVFREIPKLDLEMLLPGARPRMRLLDAGKIGGSSLTGIFSLSKMAMETVLAGKLKWLTLGFGALAYAFQSFLGYRRTKAAYVHSQTQQLYYQNLDNNAGAFCKLIDEAEDEEIKESILAYYMLSTRAPVDWTLNNLAKAVEELVRSATGTNCQFQVRDAVGKLERLGLLLGNTSQLRACPIPKAIHQLGEHWQGLCPTQEE